MMTSIKSAALCSLLIPFSNALAPQSHVNVNSKFNSQQVASSTSLDGIGSVVTRVRDSITSKERSREDLKIGIAGFYDRSSQLWEEGTCDNCWCSFIFTFCVWRLGQVRTFCVCQQA